MDTPSIPPSDSDGQPPNKYIRTYAGDMEMLQKGVTPDLKPLAPTPPPPPAPSPVPIPKPVPPPPPRPKPPEPPPKPPPVVKPPPPKPEPKTLPLQTYSDDFLQRVQKTGASTTTILAAEEDAGGASEPTPPSVHRWSVLTIVVGIVLLLFGVTGIYIGYTHYLTNNQPVVLAPSVSAPIFVDEKEEIPGDTPADLLSAIIQSMGQTLAPNSVRLLYTNDATTTGNSVFAALQLNTPDIVLRNIDATQSMAGIVNINGVVSPFFILSVTSYTDTFAGMLAWEATMPNDLSALFPPYASVLSTTTVAVATTTATKSKSKTKVATSTPPAPPPSSFYDESVDNHDVRVYQDAQGRSVFMYGYWNKTTLVIARDQDAFTEILRRLATTYTQ